MKRLALLLLVLAPLFAARAEPATGTVSAAYSSVFAQIAIGERSFEPSYADAMARHDLAGMAAVCDGRAALFRTLSETAGLPEGGRNALIRLSTILSIQGNFVRELDSGLAAGDETTTKRIEPILRATDTIAVRNATSLLYEARGVGAGKTAICVASVFPDAILVLLGDMPQPFPNLYPIQDDEELWSRLSRLAVDVVMYLPPPYAVRNTPEAKAVTAAVAAVARAESNLVSALSTSGSRSDPAVAARLMKAEIETLRKIPVGECPAPFRKAFGDYGRGRIGLATALEAAAGNNPATAGALVADLSARNERQIADKAALVRAARAVGADTAPLSRIWIDAFAHLALVPAPQTREAAAASPAQRYTDALAALLSDFEAASARAPAGAEGAKARLAAVQALYAGVQSLKSPELPMDGTNAISEFVSALRQIGMAMRRLVNESTRGQAAFLAAIQASQGDLDQREQQFNTAFEQLKDALRRAGADVSALDHLQ